MKAIPDLAQLCRDVEDRLVPALGLGSGERALYYHLLRHSHIEGRRTASISNRGLAGSFGTSHTTLRFHLRNLIQKGCVRILERSAAGHTIEVLAPSELATGNHFTLNQDLSALERGDFFRNRRLRAAILRRENSACFYCLRRLTIQSACYDHVVPVRKHGDNSFRNIVACCFDCNTSKRHHPAVDFLRQLFRSGRLSSSDLDSRLAALDSLRRGHLIPAFQA